MTTKIGERYRVTLPARVRRQFHLEVGDPIEVIVSGDTILLKPKKLVDASQEYFWTPKWQAGERETDVDIRKGRVKSARTAEEFFRKISR